MSRAPRNLIPVPSVGTRPIMPAAAWPIGRATLCLQTPLSAPIRIPEIMVAVVSSTIRGVPISQVARSTAIMQIMVAASITSMELQKS